jgi:hypothetical protein
MGVRRLAVVNSSANTDTNLYLSTNQLLMSVIATNTSASPSDIRVWVEPNGSSSSAQYVYITYDLDVDPGNSFETFRFAVNEGDLIKIRSSRAGTSFAAYGIVQYDINLGVGISSYSASAPSTPVTGMLWTDSSSNDLLKVYNGTSWVVLKKEEERFRFTATGGETSVSGSDDNSNTLAYQAGYEKVFLNGILLVRGLDYTATNGTSITGLAPLISGYILEVFSI